MSQYTTPKLAAAYTESHHAVKYNQEEVDSVTESYNSLIHEYRLLQDDIEDLTLENVELKMELNKSESSTWVPRKIRAMPPLEDHIAATIPSGNNTVTFTTAFLRDAMGSHITQHTPGAFWPTRQRKSLLNGRVFWVLERENEPFVSDIPGHHMAKLTCFATPPGDGTTDNPTQASFAHAPVFVSSGTDARGATTYTYHGNYTLLPGTDKLDSDRQDEVIPPTVLDHWIRTLGDPAARTRHEEEELISHFFTPGKYSGALDPTALAAQDRWDAVLLIGPEEVRRAFAAPDEGAVPGGLRLRLQYLRCVDWDCGFFAELVEQRGRWEGEIGRREAGRVEREMRR